MVYAQVKLFILFFLGVSINCLYAQENILSSGNYAFGNNGTVYYSIGQVFHHTYTGTGGSVGEGVHHPYEISMVTGIDDYEEIELSIWAYPNPTTQFLKLSVEYPALSNLTFSLYDMRGKLLKQGIIIRQETTVETSLLPPSMYFLKVYKGSKVLKTFKIIKK